MFGTLQKPLPFVSKGFNILMRVLIRGHLDISVGFLEALVWMPLCAFRALFDLSTKLIVEKRAGPVHMCLCEPVRVQSVDRGFLVF